MCLSRDRRRLYRVQYGFTVFAPETDATWVMRTMNKLPDWAERIPLIRAALTDIATEFIDRRQIGELFGVSSYQAGQLIRNMGPMLHGNSFVVDAQDIRKAPVRDGAGSRDP
jgi:hypothetical protein